MADDVIRRGEAVGSGLQWVVEEQRVNPQRTRGAQIGYFEGAAGIGSMLLAMDELVRNVPLKMSVRFGLPDSQWNFGYDLSG